ncbi:MAG: response regulator transcription factor, partial [Chitinophagales bacterium]
DIMMPDIVGYEICAQIKATPELNSTKVIFLSAKAKESDIARGLEEGADAYITKPFSNKNLIEKVKSLVL